MGMKGKIALCSLGCLGLITNDEKQSVSYTTLVDGALSGEAYVGIHLQDTAHAKAGDPWSSRNPYVVGDVASLTASTAAATLRAVSQVKMAGGPQPKTWEDYRQGCLNTYGGGHHSDGCLEAFHHGMETVFNLLEKEFPPAEQCQSAPALYAENERLKAQLAANLSTREQLRDIIAVWLERQGIKRFNVADAWMLACFIFDAAPSETFGGSRAENERLKLPREEDHAKPSAVLLRSEACSSSQQYGR